MADNVAITAGTGTAIATDDVSGVQYQRVKLDAGGDGVATPVLAGGGVEASALRVTLASDSTGLVSVDDNGGNLSIDDGGNSITVDNGGTFAVQAAQSGTWNVGTVTTVSAVTAISNALPAGTNAIGKLAANSGVDIGDTDVTSVIPGVGATNAGKAVDSAAGATDTGVAILAVRDDSLTTLTPADGDYTHLRVNSTGALHVVGSSGTTQYAEDVAHQTGDSVVFVGAVRRDTTPTSSAGTAGDYTAINADANGRLYVNATLYDEAGAPLTSGDYTHDSAVGTTGPGCMLEAKDFDGAALPNTVTEGDAVRAAGTLAGIAYSLLVTRDGAKSPVVFEDGASANGDAMVVVAGIRDDTLDVRSATEGDFEYFHMNANGALWNIDVNSAALLTSNQLQDDVVFADDAAFTTGTSKVTAIGAIRDDSLSTLSASEGDVVVLRVNSTGALHVTGGGGGTEFQDGAAHSGGATGTMNLAVRNDAGTVLAGVADGDYTPLTTNAAGALYVTGGGGGTEYVVDAVTPSNPTGSTFVMERDDALSALSEAEGDWTNPRATSTGALWTADINTAAALTALQVIDNPVLVDDAAFTAASSSVAMAGFIADDGAAADSADAGDAIAVRATLDRVLMVTPVPHATASGLSIFRSIDVDEGTLEVVKNSPGQVYGMWVTNRATATRWIKFYDATSGTAGTGTPVITIGIPGNATDNIAGNFGPGGMGIAFTTGICVGAVTGVADNDTGAPGTNDIILNVFYK